jgi:glycosyltransferase involved in cell wall biosynthesis
MGIPADRMIGTETTLQYFHGLFLSSWKCFLALPHICWFVFLRVPLRWLRIQARPQPREDRGCARRIAVQASFTEPRLKGLWAPVAELLGPQRTVLITRTRNTLSGDRPGYASVACDDLPFSLHEFYRHAGSAIKTLRRPVRTAVRDCGLRSGAELLVLNGLIGRILLIAQVRTALRLARPSAVVLACDQEPFDGSIGQVAEQMGIPSFTFVHGAFGVHAVSGYTPVNADYILTWGDYQKDLLLQRGVEERRILVTGCQRLEPFVRAGGDTKPGFAKKADILVGFTTLAPENWRVWSESLIELHRLLPEYRLICRLHPSSRVGRAQFRELTEHGDGLVVMESRERELRECISDSEAVIVQSGSLALDAVFMGKPLFVYDSYDSGERDIGCDMVEQGAAVYATTPKEMADRIREYLGNGQTREDLISRGREFVRKYVSCVGEEAARRTVQAILERTPRSS